MSVARPVFITGNQNKADYLAKMLGIDLEYQKVDLDEIQSMNLEEIVEYKARQAYEKIGKPVLVEDVSLGFVALDGLPGPFIKFFVEASDGLEKLCRMLDGFVDRRARAECVFGYYDGTTLRLIHGGMDGQIVTRPTGENGFGWDTIFAPVGYDGRTRAEFDTTEDARSYQQIKPIDQVKEFLLND